MAMLMMMMMTMMMVGAGLVECHVCQQPQTTLQPCLPAAPNHPADISHCRQMGGGGGPANWCFHIFIHTMMVMMMMTTTM
eukprot:8548378-Karenia_brevis.AAC.1